MNSISTKNTQLSFSMETAAILQSNNENVTVQNNPTISSLNTGEYVYNKRNLPKEGQVRIYRCKINEYARSELHKRGNVKQQSYPKPVHHIFKKKEVELLPSKVHEKHKPILHKANSNVVIPNNPKEPGQKRKIGQIRAIAPLPIVQASQSNNLHVRRYTQENQTANIVTAAKTLFLKRTRVLHHWMYPNIPNTQLKAAVARLWETLGSKEKEIYISQVLEKVGYPQANLMVNPQLTGIIGTLPPNSKDVQKVPTVSAINHAEQVRLEDHPTKAVPNYSQYNSKCYKRLNSTDKTNNRAEENANNFGNEVNDEFQNDPELSRELQQFKWNFNFNIN